MKNVECRIKDETPSGVSVIKEGIINLKMKELIMDLLKFHN